MSRVRIVRWSAPGQPAVVRASTPRWKQVGIGLLMVLHHLFAFSPLLIIAALYAASWRAGSLIGHWPQALIDDPKYIVADDSLYELLYSSVYPLFYMSCLAVIALPALTLLLGRKYPLRWSLFLIFVFIAGWVLLRTDPGQRIMWWLD